MKIHPQEQIFGEIIVSTVKFNNDFMCPENSVNIGLFTG
jgi:hypothetical protein